MFRTTRSLHRWIGIVNSLFLVLIASTGFFLATKKRFEWIQPPTKSGSEMASLEEAAPIAKVLSAAVGAGIPELAGYDHVDRFELHTGKQVWKVTSKSGYHEVQVDAKSGEVLSIARRNDQFFEDLHDMSFLNPAMHEWVLPLVACSLLFLGVSGIYMYSVPVWRRFRYNRSKSAQKTS